MDTYMERVLVGIRRIEDEVDRLRVHLNLDTFDESLPVVLVQHTALAAAVAAATVRRLRRYAPGGTIVPKLRVTCYEGTSHLASLPDTYRIEPVRHAD